MTFKKVAGPQTYDLTIGNTTFLVCKNGQLWEALKFGEVVAYGTSRKAVAEKLLKVAK